MTRRWRWRRRWNCRCEADAAPFWLKPALIMRGRFGLRALPPSGRGGIICAPPVRSNRRAPGAPILGLGSRMYFMRPATHWSCQRRAFGGAEIFRAPSHFWAIGIASAAPLGGRGDISCAQPPQTPGASVLGHWNCERRTRGGAEIFRAPSPPRTARCFNPEPLELRAPRPWASGGAEIFCAPSHPRAPGASSLGHWSCDCRARGGADIFHAPSPPPPSPSASCINSGQLELRVANSAPVGARRTYFVRPATPREPGA